jgi:hypothetical protein
MNKTLDRISMRTPFICVTVTVTSPLERIYISAEVTRRPFGFQPKGWCFQEVGTDRSTFAVISLWGKFGGLHACAATFSYIVPLPNIFLTRLFSKLRLKRKDFQEILRLPWAQEVPGSNPGAPTKNISRVFFYLLKAAFTSNPICGILADRRSGFASHLLSESSPHDEFSKT